jgi:hypothetical protein
VDAAAVAMENRQFWRAIGYDGLFKLVHEPAGQFLLDRGAARGTIQYLRAHFTFSNRDPADARFGGSICGRVMTIREDGTATYDFSHVNRTFREYVKRGMKPIVEFDFFPDGLCWSEQEQANDEGFATYSELIKRWDLWTDLLHRFMGNLEANFGKDELMDVAELRPDRSFRLEAAGGRATLAIQIPRHGMALLELSMTDREACGI